MTAQADFKAIRQDFQAFLTQFQSVILATVSADGRPESSYAPYLYHNGCFYIYVSELAAHTRNLLVSSEACPDVSLMWIESEQETRNVFARKRATIHATAQAVPRDSEAWADLMGLMAERLGDTIGLIRPLTDFHLFELTPHSASYVTGFAKAYRLEGETLELRSN